MNRLSKLRTVASGLTLSFALLLGMGSSALAAPAHSAAKGQTPPASSAVSGVQAKPPVAPGSQDAKTMAPLGPTHQVTADAAGKPLAAPLTGNVSGVDFSSPYNYCWRNLVYTPVRNTTSAIKYVQVVLYNQGASHTIYSSIAANSTAYPAFYGIDGAYTAYLYVWNGSSYQYDEYVTGTNTCNVSVTRVYNAGGWVELKIQNLGTAYATQISSELAPFPGSGTYTGTHYDYPAAGGAALYRWFWVSTSPYGITSSTYGSFNLPYLFSGDL